jgi:hypothetical protein
MSDKSLTRTIKSAKLYTEQIVTHPMNMFLMNTPNLVVDEWVADLIRKEITKQPRERSGSFSSSAAGSCLRRQVFAYKGIDTGGVNDPQLQNIFYDGTWRHLRWQAVLLQAGILTAIEYPLPWPEKQSVGTMDGIGVVPDTHPTEKWRGLEFGFELKGCNTYTYQSIVRSGAIKEDHLNQVHRYFLSGGFDLFVVIYEDKNNQQWQEFVIEPDPVRLEEQRAELDALNDYVNLNVLPPMLDECQKQTGNDWKYCPYAGKNGVCLNRKEW